VRIQHNLVSLNESTITNPRIQVRKLALEEGPVPEKYNPSLPVIFATEPSGARLPYNIWIWPVSLMGFDNGRIIC